MCKFFVNKSTVSTSALTLACHARALIGFIRLRLPLLSVQRERTLGKSIDIILTFRKRLQASPPSRHASLSASRVRISGVADHDFAVEKHIRVVVDILEGFQAKPLTLVARAGMELQRVVFVHWAPVEIKFHRGVLLLWKFNLLWELYLEDYEKDRKKNLHVFPSFTLLEAARRRRGWRSTLIILLSYFFLFVNIYHC